MRIIKLSEDFTPRHEGLLYGIDVESEQPRDVTIEVVDMASSEVVATQRLREITTAEVNIAHYIEPITGYTPSHAAHTTFKEAPSRCTMIRSGEDFSAPIITSVNRCHISRPSCVCAMPNRRTISYGEVDEVLILAAEGETLTANIVADTGESLSLDYGTATGAAILSISTKDFGKKFRTLDVELLCNGESLGHLHYTAVPAYKGSLRLAWVSGAGSIERYTFPVVVKSQLSTVKESIDTSEGRRVVSAVSKSILSLKSRYEAAATIEALAEIISSPRVWIEGASGCAEVEVESLSVDKNLFNEPDIVAINILEWRKEEPMVW